MKNRKKSKVKGIDAMIVLVSLLATASGDPSLTFMKVGEGGLSCASEEDIRSNRSRSTGKFPATATTRERDLVIVLEVEPGKGRAFHN